MRNKFILAATLVVAIFLLSCNRDTVALSYTNAKNEVPQLGNLVFRFSKALVNDSLLNFWDSTEYISFEPRIKGRFRWQNTDELVFSPSQPLSPATNYKATINDDVLRYTRYNRVKQSEALSFHTAPLQLNDAQVSWILEDEGSHKAMPQLNLHFNYAVKPDDLKEKLVVEVDGKPASFSFQTISPSDQIVIRLLNFTAQDKNYETKIRIAKGLVPQNGNNGNITVYSFSLCADHKYYRI